MKAHIDNDTYQIHMILRFPVKMPKCVSNELTSAAVNVKYELWQIGGVLCT